MYNLLNFLVLSVVFILFQTLLLGGLAEHLAVSPVHRMVNTFREWIKVLIVHGGAT